MLVLLLSSIIPWEQTTTLDLMTFTVPGQCPNLYSRAKHKTIQELKEKERSWRQPLTLNDQHLSQKWSFCRVNFIFMVSHQVEGLLYGTAVFAGLLVLLAIIVGIAFRKGKSCYAITFSSTLVVMSYILWACTYMCQMYPLIVPQYTAHW